MTADDLDTLFHCLYYARRALQLLAAILEAGQFAAAPIPCDLAGDLDALVSVAWGAAR